jgi:uncharacterized protein
MTLLFLLAVLAVSVVSGATAGVVGFGIGSLLTPLLAARYGTDTAILLVAIPHTAATALRLTRHWAQLDWRFLRWFGSLSAAGGLIGAWIQSQLGVSGLGFVLGALLLATGIANLTEGFGRWKPALSLSPLLGFLSGLFGGIAGNQGGLRAAALLPYGLSPRAFLATGTAVAMAIDLARTPVYLARGGSELGRFWLPILVATMGCLGGTVLGERVMLGLPQARYRRLVGGAVAALGVWLLVQWAGQNLR